MSTKGYVHGQTFRICNVAHVMKTLYSHTSEKKKNQHADAFSHQPVLPVPSEEVGTEDHC